MPNFIPPNFNPRGQDFDLAPTLESVFNAYMQMRTMKAQDDMNAMRQQQVGQQMSQSAQTFEQGQAANRVKNQLDWGQPYMPSPGTLQQAGGLQQFTGPIQDPRLSGAVEGLRRLGQQRDMAQRGKEAEVSLKEAQAKWYSERPTGEKPSVYESTQQREEAKASTKARTDMASSRALLQSMSPELDRISEINRGARGGMMGAGLQKVSSALNVGQGETFQKTADVVNSLRGFVARVLKSTFGGQLSDSERAYLDSVYGAAEKFTQVEREIAIKNIRRMLESKAGEAEAKYQGLSGGSQSTQSAESAESIREAFRSGKISRDEAKRKISALGK